jgi:hypothetical protein
LRQSESHFVKMLEFVIFANPPFADNILFYSFMPFPTSVLAFCIL